MARKSRTYPHNIEGSRYGKNYRVGYTSSPSHSIARIYGQSGYYSIYALHRDGNTRTYLGTVRTLTEASARLYEFGKE